MEKFAGDIDAQGASTGLVENTVSKSMTQTQIGTIGEVTVAAQLMLGSNGRFSPFLPFADDDGIDLIVYDKVTGASLQNGLLSIDLERPMVEPQVRTIDIVSADGGDTKQTIEGKLQASAKK